MITSPIDPMLEGDSGRRSDAADPLIGKVLNGRFSITEVIGTGGMGRVYKAVQAPLDRIVAIKVLSPSYGASGRDPNFQRRFFLEASLTSKLRHPNTITVIDYGKADDGIFYIAMEYVDGQTLAQLLSAHGPLPWPRALHIAQQICRSLREAHKSGIIHRDLKPANVMLLSEETDHDLVKVLDFGLVKSLVSDGDIEITQAGMMLGSPLYMAPEQSRQVADARSDIYSLGVLLYHMLMGRPPFQSRESVDAILKHINQRPPPFLQLRPDHNVPPEVEAVVMKCLEKDPDYRYASMDELLEAFRAAASTHGMSGMFADPRIGSSAGRTPPPLPPPLPQRTATVETTRADRAQRIDAPADVTEDIAVELSDVRPSPRRGNLLWVALFVGSIILGAAGVLWLRGHRDGDHGTPSAAPQAAAAAAAAAEASNTDDPTGPPQDDTVDVVTFQIATEPAGAQVFWNDKALGPAPIDLQVPRGADGVAEATFTFRLDGYVERTIRARATEATHGVREQLRRKPVAPPPARKPPATRPQPSSPKRTPDPGATDDGYKDDPYD